jgi:hypothetical protein
MRKTNIMTIIIALFALAGMTLTGCTSVENNVVTQSNDKTDSPTDFSFVDVPFALQGSTSAGIIKSQPSELELTTDFPVIPEQLMAYQMIKPEVNDQYARDIADKFGFYDEWPLHGGEREVYTYKKDDQSIEISINGGISYRQKLNISYVPQELPDDQKCIEIARHWLETYDLYPSDVTEIKVGYGMSVASFDSETKVSGTPVYYSKRVSFIFNIGDYQDISPGASILINDKGDVIQASINKRSYQEYGLVKLKTSQDAYDILREYLSRLTPVVEDAPECIYSPDGNYVNINSIKIMYTGIYQSNYIVPVYVLEGESRNDGSKPEKFKAMVDAVKR